MRMFTKIGVTAATTALPVLLWAGAAGAQQSPQDPQSGQSGQSSVDCSQQSAQSQSQCNVSTVAPLPQTTGTGGSLARTGAEDMLPLALGGVALAGAVAVRGVRRRSAA